MAPTSVNSSQSARSSASPPLARAWHGLWAWLGWHFWILLAIVLTGGLGVYALAQLVRLPGIPECESTYWPLAPAGKRIFCGQSYAARGTVEDVLAAIALADKVEADHPLRPEVDEKIASWTEQLLALGELQFQAGHLDRAIEMAERVPAHLATQASVADRIAAWKDLWTRGVATVDLVQQQALAAQWQDAFITAARLTQLPNAYWADRRYNELVESVRVARSEYEDLSAAEDIIGSNNSNAKSLIEAITSLSSIRSESWFHARAQQLFARASERLVERGKQAAKRNDWSEVLDVARALPPSQNLEAYRRDFRELARAGLLAQQGSVASLESAIEIAEAFAEDRPLHSRAQGAIQLWQAEVADIGHLKAARQKARGGSVASLRAAIAEVKNIPAGNPRYREAQQEIWAWVARIQTIEDRPTLDRAVRISRGSSIEAWRQAITVANNIAPRRALYRDAQKLVSRWQVDIERAEDAPVLNRARSIARGGTIAAWTQAIAIATEIAPRRALHREARQSIRQWQVNIERAEDGPILNRARSLASQGLLAEAIAAISQIAPGRVLHGEAQQIAGPWQAELQANRDLNRAYALAAGATPQSLSQAIQVASQIPASTPAGNRSRQEIEAWSRRLFGLAREESAVDLARAIQIAQLVPANSQVYAAARTQIDLWQRELAPPPAVETVAEENAAEETATPAAP